MNTVYLLLGSNLGNPQQQLLAATKAIVQRVGNIASASSFYSTAAWGLTAQPNFINQVLVVTTKLDALTTLHTILAIENDLGRTRSVKYAARVIDIDILFFNNQIIDVPQLKVPHPQIQNRRFVLIPLAELNENLIHPSLQKNIKTLLQTCSDTLDVQKI
ncbi:2-amino-4-hydroxy-6-hydroxymethyldihydropteridine diphosphokinase [Ferruginibacter yonginensis]|uniref:2-amino-4-hydroxy-6-hydroxymethyldihydropteridine pyrophosphokinase n=1 Tax=Ferruginibacter yonginensis TaxID=1310416 RepID=A0ABV8QTV6_9BACT